MWGTSVSLYKIHEQSLHNCIFDCALKDGPLKRKSYCFLLSSILLSSILTKDTFIKQFFPFFSAVSSAFAFKICKICHYDIKRIFFQNKIGVSKKAEFWCWFRIRWKSCKTFHAIFTFNTECKSFQHVTFCYFFALFSRDSNSNFAVMISNFWRDKFFCFF
jgi:hypothetical protein